MSISSSNVLFIYNSLDNDSKTLAEKYRDIHNLDNAQLVGIAFSNLEILQDYTTFLSDVETPIVQAVNSSAFPISVIILGFNVPGGFRDGTDIISSTSRISRAAAGFSYSTVNAKTHNKLFDRKVFSGYIDADRLFAYICTRMDAPTPRIVEDWLKLSEIAKNANKVTGTFFLDPFSGFVGKEADRYTNDMLDFSVSLLSKLGLNISSTSFIDPYVDAIIPRLQDDGFFWGWGADESSLSYFKETSSIRGFFYNADFDGASTVRDINSRSWPMLAIRAGYVATAGSMSNPDIDGFMRPYPFFNALFRGVTLGEAMLFATPHVDWTIAHFGDPLLIFTFPDVFIEQTLISEDEMWQRIESATSESLAYVYRKSALLESMRDRVIAGCDVSSAVDLLIPFNTLVNYFGNTGWKTDFVNITKDLVKYARNRSKYRLPEKILPNFDEYLTFTKNKVHSLLMDTLEDQNFVNTISVSNFEEEGTWFLDFVLEHNDPLVKFYDFQLEVSDIIDFSDIIITADSNINSDGWFFENDLGGFSKTLQNGVSSNFVGRKIRYINQEDEKLTRGNIYYFRIRQFDGSSFLDYKNFTKIIFT